MKESIESLSVLFDKVYSAFILRDIAGKIIPGMIFIVGLFFVFFNMHKNLIDIILKLNFGIWLFLIVFFWIMGYVMQSFGEFFNIIVYALELNKKNKIMKYKKINLEKIYERQAIIYNLKDEENNLKYIERLASVRESCGNSASALIFLFLIFNIVNFDHLFNVYKSFYKEIFILLIFIFFLWRMHREHAYRYWCALNALINKNNKLD